MRTNVREEENLVKLQLRGWFEVIQLNRIPIKVILDVDGYFSTDKCVLLHTKAKKKNKEVLIFFLFLLHKSMWHVYSLRKWCKKKKLKDSSFSSFFFCSNTQSLTWSYECMFTEIAHFVSWLLCCVFLLPRKTKIEIGSKRKNEKKSFSTFTQKKYWGHLKNFITHSWRHFTLWYCTYFFKSIMYRRKCRWLMLVENSRRSIDFYLLLLLTEMSYRKCKLVNTCTLYTTRCLIAPQKKKLFL